MERKVNEIKGWMKPEEKYFFKTPSPPDPMVGEQMPNFLTRGR